MKVAVTVKPRAIEYQEREIPKINQNEVLIKMKYVGVCGSDIHIYKGVHPFVGPEYYPLVQGHEGVAYVEKIGAKVNNVKVGDFVTIMPQLYCNECEMCKTGKMHICENLKVLGCQCDGLFAEYFAINSSLLLKLPKTKDLLPYSIIEPLAVSIGAVRKLGSLGGKRVMVFGAGVIGLNCAQVAKAFGSKEVTIVDLDEKRLDKAINKCLVDSIINPANVTDETVYDGYDFVVECVGVEATLRTAINHVKKSGTIIVAGVFGKEVKLPISLVQDREIKIYGSLMYEVEDYICAIDFIQNKRIAIDPIIYKVIPFDKYDSAYALIDENKGEATKIVVKF